MDKQFRAWYDTYLASPTWKAVRETRLRKDRNKCRGCGTTENLHVHHITYERFTRENQADLITVCQTCHSLIHRTAREQHLTVEAATWRVLRSLKAGQLRTRKPPRITKDDRCYCGKLIKDGHRHMGEEGQGKSLPWEFPYRKAS